MRIFNAGRTAESLEHIVLGDRKGGAGGLDLTDHLRLSLRLEPGETKVWRLNPRASPLAERWASASAGWASLWVLTGSMKQRRAEVIPFPRTDSSGRRVATCAATCEVGSLRAACGDNSLGDCGNSRWKFGGDLASRGAGSLRAGTGRVGAGFEPLFSPAMC